MRSWRVVARPKCKSAARKEDKLDPDILEYENESRQGIALEVEEILPLDVECLGLVAGGDVGSGLIKIPK